MNTIYEHFQEKLLSLSMELDGAIMRRILLKELDEYKLSYKKRSLEEKLKYLKELETL